MKKGCGVNRPIRGLRFKQKVFDAIKRKLRTKKGLEKNLRYMKIDSLGLHTSGDQPAGI